MFNKPKRKVNKVFIHCSASDLNIIKNKLLQKITKWHIARGFDTIGYHFIIDKEGNIIEGRDTNIIPAAQKGHNRGSIAICVHGLNKFTKASMNAIKTLSEAINKEYDGKVTFHGHCEVNKLKTCPVFDYKKVLCLDNNGYIKERPKMLDFLKGKKTYIGIVAGLVYMALIEFTGIESIETVWGAIAAWTGVSLRAAIKKAEK